MSIVRARLSAEDSRAAALDAARALLIEQGPQAVTLKAVAARIGRTHANLLHHFGSAAGLQTALIAAMARSITATIAAEVARARRGESTPAAIVDMTFDAFDKQGAAALVYRLVLNGETAALDPVLDAIRALVAGLMPGAEGRPLAEMTVALVQAALGDALIGDALTRALGLPRAAGRAVALRQIAGLAGGEPRSG